MLAHGFDAVERDGVLRFVMRDGRVDAVLVPQITKAEKNPDGGKDFVGAGGVFELKHGG